MSRRPNFIFIIADDHRFESLGVNCPLVQSPNLDRLAARGTIFENAHCQGGMQPAVCTPSRASLMTGRNIFASSAQPAGPGPGEKPFKAATIPANLATFPQRLRDAGYHTHAVGKWHNDAATFKRSFTSAERVFFGGMSDHDRVPLHDLGPDTTFDSASARFEAGLSTDLFQDSACRFIEEQRGKDEPFCLYVAFTAPHDPRTPPAEFTVDPASVPLPANYLPVHPFDNGEAVVRDEMLEAFPRPPEAVRQHIADYYGMIAHLDAAIGKILDTAEDAGVLEDTVVVYTADHGLSLGQHGLMGKQNLYQHSINVPLIMAGQGIPAGQRLSPLVWHADTRATVLDLAGIENEAESDGASLLPIMQGTVSAHREVLGAAYRTSHRMVRDARYKLIRYTEPKIFAEPGVTGDDMESRGSSVVQLFDLQADPGETINLAYRPDMHAVRARLEQALVQWQRSVNDPMLA